MYSALINFGAARNSWMWSEVPIEGHVVISGQLPQNAFDCTAANYVSNSMRDEDVSIDRATNTMTAVDVYSVLFR